MYFVDWEEAAKKSKWSVAIGRIIIEHKGRRLRAEVLKPLHGDGIICYYHSRVKIRDATAREIDSIKRWKPW